jgi:LPXTG-motif cell wall-anchored protein
MQHLTYVDGSARVYAYGYDANTYANAGVEAYNWFDITDAFTVSFASKVLTVEANGTSGLKGTLFDGNKGYIDNVISYPDLTAENAIDTMSVEDIENETGADGYGVFLSSTSKIVVLYDATLDDDAVMGSTGNPNEVYLEFSNNPNEGGEGEKGTTPKDTAIVFTYNVVVNKVEKDTNSSDANATKALTGADFKLFKKYTTDNATEAGKTAATMPTAGITAAEWTLDTGYIWVEVTGIKSDAANGTKNAVFTFNRIDDGDYMLVETVTPSGYNTIAPQKFTVSATHASGALTALSGNPANGAVITMTSTLTEDEAKLSTNVLNNSGTVLPSTGGIGTTIFYVVGSILVVAAGVLLITKKRMGRE